MCVSVPCPYGSYQDGGECVVCPVGKYQDETGKSECKACDDDKMKSTSAVGSRSVNECISMSQTY